METTRDGIKAKIKRYILEEFLPDEDPDALKDGTELITTGVLDSIATVKLVSFLSDEFGVEFEAHEMDVDHLNTLNDITRTVEGKL